MRLNKRPLNETPIFDKKKNGKPYKIKGLKSQKLVLVLKSCKLIKSNSKWDNDVKNVRLCESQYF